MADLEELSRLAREHMRNRDLSFTGGVLHATVETFARFWMPDIHFHFEERFHPVDLKGLYTHPFSVFEGLEADDRERFSIKLGGEPLEPPVIFFDLGRPLFDIIDVRGSGGTALAALEDPEVTDNAIVTHGKNFDFSRKFFGAGEAANETDVPRPGEPRDPAHDIVVRAELRMLLETLELELALVDAGIDGPLDGIWGGFDVTRIVLPKDPISSFPDATTAARQDILRRLIAAHRAGDVAEEENILANPPAGTLVSRAAWDAIKHFAFLEYHLVYAYNDFDEYGPAFFTNFHEGDNEGFCLVFDRIRLERFQENPLEFPIEHSNPVAIITSAHEERNRADEICALDEDADDPREGLEVFVARGSHATYLKAGKIDFLDYDDLRRTNTITVIVGTLFAPVLFPIYLILEHFLETKDETSDAGVTAVPDVDPASDPDTHEQITLVVTPLSAFGDQNIYETGVLGTEELAIRAYNGKLGAHFAGGNFVGGLLKKNVSPKWKNKTPRFLRRLVSALEKGIVRPPLSG